MSSNRRSAPTHAPRGVYYDDFERRTDIVKVFRLYDSDESAKIDEREFRKLIKDLFILRRGTSVVFSAAEESNLDLVVRSIASLIPSAAGCKIDLGEFIEAALARENISPFNRYPNGQPATDGGLQSTLLTFFHVRNESILNQIHPFVPNWEPRVLEWWQGSVPRNCYTILDQRGGPKKASISDPIQVRLSIDNAPPTYEGLTIDGVQIKAGRFDTIPKLLSKVRDNWPGVRGRNFVCPSLEQLTLIRGGRPVPLFDVPPSASMSGRGTC